MSHELVAIAHGSWLRLYLAGGARFPQATIVDMFCLDACTLMKNSPVLGVATVSSALEVALPSLLTSSGLYASAGPKIP